MRIFIALLLICLGAHAQDLTWTNGFERVYNVRLYGATGNGSTDDAAAIQSAIDAADAAQGGTVYFPNGTYRINTGLFLGTTNGQHFISLRGETQVRSVLSYTGPTNGFAVTLLTDKYVTVENLFISRSGPRGTTAGILFTGPVGGTTSNGGYMRSCIFSGWHVCIDPGPDNSFPGTSSEWTFDNITFQNSDIGFANFDFNGLNFMFRQLQADTVETVIFGHTAGISVDGGSWSNCGLGFLAENGGLYSIRNVRAESQRGPFAQTVAAILIESCLASFVGAATNNAIRLSGENARIIESQIFGKIVVWNSISGGVAIHDCGIDDVTPINLLPGKTVQNLSLKRNYRMSFPSSAVVAPFPDTSDCTWPPPPSGITTNIAVGKNAPQKTLVIENGIITGIQ